MVSTCHDVAAGTEELLRRGLQCHFMLWSCTAEAYAGRSHKQAHNVWTKTSDSATLFKGWEYPEVPSEQLSWIYSWEALSVSVSS